MIEKNKGKISLTYNWNGNGERESAVKMGSFNDAELMMDQTNSTDANSNCENYDY